MALETLLAYARTRQRMAREHDVRKLLAAARVGQANRPRDVSLPEARTVARVVSVTLASLPRDPRCMVRSLVLVELLAHRGMPAKFVIGTSAAADFSAHAWVEMADEALLPAGGFAGGRLAEL